VYFYGAFAGPGYRNPVFRGIAGFRRHTHQELIAAHVEGFKPLYLDPRLGS
jgi:hypothetical protein